MQDDAVDYPRMIDRVRIDTDGSVVVITWAERQELLARLRRNEGAGSLVATFEGVGTSRAVTMTADECDVLTTALEAWPSFMPPGIEGLRTVLAGATASQGERG